MTAPISEIEYLEKLQLKYGCSFSVSNYGISNPITHRVLDGKYKNSTFSTTRRNMLYDRRHLPCAEDESLLSRANSHRKSKLWYEATLTKKFGVRVTVRTSDVLLDSAKLYRWYDKDGFACELTPHIILWSRSGFRAPWHDSYLESNFLEARKYLLSIGVVLEDAEYKGSLFRYPWTCRHCGRTGAYRGSALARVRRGCTHCAKVKRYSKQSIAFLDECSSYLRKALCIEHSENRVSGEFEITDRARTFRVDGYIPKLKLVIEFHGSAFHGDPKLYSRSDHPHPFNGSTAASLYANTVLREKAIRKAGYRLISVWSSDCEERVGRERQIKRVLRKVELLYARYKNV